MHIYIVFLKKLQPLFLYSTYELVRVFINFNRNDISLFKQIKEWVWKKSCLIYILYKAWRMSESSFSHSFMVVFPFSFVGNATIFFIYSLNRLFLKKCCLHVAGFLQLNALFHSLYMPMYLSNACNLNWEENPFDFYIVWLSSLVK